jgi:hypothetical protein
MPAFGQYEVVAATLEGLALPNLGPTGHHAA